MVKTTMVAASTRRRAGFGMGWQMTRVQLVLEPGMQAGCLQVGGSYLSGWVGWVGRC